MSGQEVLSMTYQAARDALSEHQAEIERHLAQFGLTLDDIPKRCYRVNYAESPLTSTYYFDGRPILEMKINIDSTTIRFEVKPL